MKERTAMIREIVRLLRLATNGQLEFILSFLIGRPA